MGTGIRPGGETRFHILRWERYGVIVDIREKCKSDILPIS